MYDPTNYGSTVRVLASMAEYINHIDDKFSLDNVMALELLNEPWAHLVRQLRARRCRSCCCLTGCLTGCLAGRPARVRTSVPSSR